MYIHNLESVFIQLGPLTIRYYGILLALAFLTGYFILIKTAKERNIKKELMDDLLLYLIPSILIGARVFHILFYDFSYYSANPLEIFYIWKGGIASHGGLLFGILAVLIYCKKKKIPFYSMADILVIPAALSVFFVRIGNFINGELVGRVANLPWAVKFQGFEGFRHPTQLYEALIGLITSGFLYSIRSVKKKPGFLFWLFIAIFSGLRFLVEFTKDYAVLSSGLTMGQLLSIPFFIIGVVMLLKKI